MSKVSNTSERLQEALIIRDMKQVDLVEKTGISRGSISNYVSGTYEPKQDNVYKLARALNVSPTWLMGYDIPMERDTTETLAAHLDGDFTAEELEEIRKFAEYIKSRRK